ncbi:DUF6229 family protein [Kitasatospora sp. NBC_01250]|uniref:DUF6229 family protein n=1 Tax=unclassified Kitasatospora TaxID=2633591 RepID=UPI002E12CACD|nr:MULTISPECIES: DUF6229 family protein [unclassified Kitasatospora]WSJ65404.1 DUF6229 family protein [Kitasatospora sp. NBC_01302]
MTMFTRSRTDALVAAWLSGAEGVDGLANPAGPLYVGGAAAEAALAESYEGILTHCSSCSASLHSYCC